MDMKTGKEKATLKGHTDWVFSVAFSLDGKTLASGGGDRKNPGEVKLWDVATGKEKANLGGHMSVVYCVPSSRRKDTCLGEF